MLQALILGLQTFYQVGEFANTQPMKNEDQLYFILHFLSDGKFQTNTKAERKV